MRILGISLGTRDNGIALISQGQLIHWQLHSFQGVWSDNKLHIMLKRIDRYITHYRVRTVVIKIPPATHHTEAFLTLLKKVTELIQYRGCLVACKTKEDIKGMVPEVTNTDSLMEYVTRHYPILLPEQAQERANRHPYQIKMFEAVLAAHLHRKHPGE
jgi:RNase H-fold protein (predicted Holliday junction resolvase)